MNPLILGSLFGEGGCPVRSYLDYVRLVAEATMVRPPADGQRHDHSQPEQVADGESEGHGRKFYFSLILREIWKIELFQIDSFSSEIDSNHERILTCDVRH